MVRFWFIYTTHIIYNTERGLGVHTGCCVGLATCIGGFGPNLACQTVWHDNFFVRPDIEKNSLLHFSNTASDEIPRVSDSVYSAVLNISIFVNAPQKMSDLECQTLFRSITRPKPSPENFWTWFSFVSDKIESDRYQFWGNRVSSRRDTCLQTRPTKNSVLSSEKPLATYPNNL